jgi:hypothetical protein
MVADGWQWIFDDWHQSKLEDGYMIVDSYGW